MEIQGISQQLKMHIARIGEHLNVQFPLNKQTSSMISDFMNRHERLGACAAAHQKAVFWLLPPTTVAIRIMLQPRYSQPKLQGEFALMP